MDPLREHPWDVSLEEARRIQESLRARRSESRRPRRIAAVAGADAAYDPESGRTYAAAVVLSYPGMEILEVQIAAGRVSFPYIAGYLTFREGPILLQVFRKLRRRPDAIIFDGQGIDRGARSFTSPPG